MIVLIYIKHTYLPNAFPRCIALLSDCDWALFRPLFVTGKANNRGKRLKAKDKRLDRGKTFLPRLPAGGFALSTLHLKSVPSVIL